jgi:hypothetical protein
MTRRVMSSRRLSIYMKYCVWLRNSSYNLVNKRLILSCWILSEIYTTLKMGLSKWRTKMDCSLEDMVTRLFTYSFVNSLFSVEMCANMMEMELRATFVKFALHHFTFLWEDSNSISSLSGTKLRVSNWKMLLCWPVGLIKVQDLAKLEMVRMRKVNELLIKVVICFFSEAVRGT